MESTPMNVRNLERITKFVMIEVSNYGGAKIVQERLKDMLKDQAVKIKIFARSNGTFDVVPYQKIGAVVKEQVVEKAVVPEKVEKVHGLKSKERKKPFVPKKFA
jgi:hypothetical protein